MQLCTSLVHLLALKLICGCVGGDDHGHSYGYGHTYGHTYHGHTNVDGHGQGFMLMAKSLIPKAGEDGDSPWAWAWTGSGSGDAQTCSPTPSAAVRGLLPLSSKRTHIRASAMPVPTLALNTILTPLLAFASPDRCTGAGAHTETRVHARTRPALGRYRHRCRCLFAPAASSVFHIFRGSREAPSRQPPPTILYATNNPEDPEIASLKESITSLTAEIAAFAQKIAAKEAMQDSLSPEQLNMLVADKQRLAAKEQQLAADKQRLLLQDQQFADIRRSDKEEKMDREGTASRRRLQELLQEIEKLEIALDGPEKFTVPENVPFASKINEAQIPCYPGLGSTPYLLMHNLSAQPKQRGAFVKAFLARVDAFRVPGLMVGVSGAGKTRTICEILSQRFGLLFVASTMGNGGLNDMEIAVADIKRSLTSDVEKNAEIAHHRIAAAVLVRQRLLNRMHTLHPNMTPLEWLWIQSHPPLSLRKFVSPLGSDIWEECSFGDIRRAIANTPGDSLCFIDEAQRLAKECNGQFPSSSEPPAAKEGRPLLSAILKAMIQLEVKVVVAGTGLRMTDAIEFAISASGGKPGTDIPTLYQFDCLDADQVQSYLQTFVDLPGDQSQLICGTLRGRPRFVAGFVSQVLEDPLTPIEATFAQYMYQLTSRDFAYSPLLHRHKASLYANFESILRNLKDVSTYWRSEQKAFEFRTKLQIMILDTARRGYTNVEISAESAELVERGVARLLSIDPIAKSVIDEPLVVLAGWNFFDPELFLKEQIGLQSTESSRGYWFEQLVVHLLQRDLFNGKIRLEHHPGFANRAVSQQFYGSWYVRTGCMVGQQATDNFTLADWVEGPWRSTSFYPDDYAGADVVFKVCNVKTRKEAWVWAQIKFKSSLSEADQLHALATTSFRNVYTRRDGTVYQTRAAERERILESVRISGAPVFGLLIAYPASILERLADETKSAMNEATLVVDKKNAHQFFSNELLAYLDSLKAK